jgi:hypothetical protein
MVDSVVENADRVARWRVPVALALAAGCYLLLLAAGSRLLNDPDTYWQIVLGDWIVAHGQVPHADTFSATLAGTPWISSQWLAQVLFAQAYAVAGWAGVVVLSATAIATAQGLLTRFLLDRLAVAPALVMGVGGFVLASPHLVARAHVLALPVMVAWIAGLIRALDERRAPPFVLLPLIALWANLHGGFTFGIFFIAPVAIEALWNAAPAERTRVALRWIGFGLLAVAASCVTPYGAESILVTSRILGLGQALSLIVEWRPQDFSTLTAFEFCLLLCIGFALHRGLTLPPIRLLVLLGLLHMALAHSRYSELLGFLAPLVIAAPLAPQLGRREFAPHRVAAWSVTLAMVFALGIVSVGLAPLMNYQPSPLTTPAAAVAAVKASGKTRILNSYDFGGYLIASGLKPYIDGRTELYGEAFVVRHDHAINLQDVGAFLQLLQDDHIDVTLLTPNTPAIGLLDRLPDWKRVYADGIAVVHVRTPKN